MAEVVKITFQTQVTIVLVKSKVKPTARNHGLSYGREVLGLGHVYQKILKSICTVFILKACLSTLVFELS